MDIGFKKKRGGGGAGNSETEETFVKVAKIEK